MTNTIPLTLSQSAHKKYFRKILARGLNGHRAGDECILKGEGYDEWFETIHQESVMLTGVYWCLGALKLLSYDENKNEKKDGGYLTKKGVKETTLVNFEEREFLHELIFSCKCGYSEGFCSHPNRSHSVLASLSAVQSLQLLNYQLDIATQEELISYALSAQDVESGEFRCSYAKGLLSEPDLRYVLCCLGLIVHVDFEQTVLSNAIHRDVPNIDQFVAIIKARLSLERRTKLKKFILACFNEDGGFGCSPGNESHGGFLSCAISSLALLGELQCLKDCYDRIVRYINNRLIHTSDSNVINVNGRPGKTADVCYHWWILSAAVILDRYFSKQPSDMSTKKECVNINPALILDQTKLEGLIRGILSCEHPCGGGFSRLPPSKQPEHIGLMSFFTGTTGDVLHTKPDPFHSFVALASLSLLVDQLNKLYKSDIDLRLNSVDPILLFPF